jgi:cytochrome c-type biogenesis protein CcmH/NrfG
LTQARAALKPGSSPWLLAMFNVGMAQVETQAFPTAIRSLEQVVAAEPQNLLAWLWLSRAYTGNQQLTDAQQAIQRARELDPDLTQRFLNP